MLANESNILCILQDFHTHHITNLLKSNNFANIFDFFNSYERTLSIEMPDIVILETELYRIKKDEISQVLIVF